MSYKFIYIDSKENIEVHTPTIVDVFSALFNVNKYVANKHSIILYYENTYLSSISAIISNLVEDMYIDLRVYESRVYNSLEAIDKDLDFAIKLIDELPFYQVKYLNNKELLKSGLDKITQKLKKLVLGSFYDDNEMLKTVKLFLENNQNSTNASKELYIHRNTLNQRLDKFEAETGFNVKTFYDAFLIYHLLI